MSAGWQLQCDGTLIDLKLFGILPEFGLLSLLYWPWMEIPKARIWAGRGRCQYAVCDTSGWLCLSQCRNT